MYLLIMQYNKYIKSNIPHVILPGSSWNSAQRKGIKILFNHLPDMELNIGITLEGKKEDELPEQILFCAILNHFPFN